MSNEKRKYHQSYRNILQGEKKENKQEETIQNILKTKHIRYMLCFSTVADKLGPVFQQKFK